MSMMSETATRSRWIKPALIGAAVLAIALGFYVSLSKSVAAPEVTYISLSGEKISSQSLRGKVVIVNFWATDCATCIKEMPQMVQTYQKFKGQGFEFVAVAMKSDPPNYVINFTESRQLPFKVALDSSGGLAKAFGNVAMTPTTFVIDKQGNIIKRYVGEPEFGALHQLLQKALAG
jgi:peroxiredoxin